jgi:hypothetical protein
MIEKKIHTVHIIVDGKIDNYIVFHHSHSESALKLQGGEEEFNLDYIKHETNDSSVEMFFKQTSKRMNDPISLSSIFLGDAQLSNFNSGTQMMIFCQLLWILLDSQIGNAFHKSGLKTRRQMTNVSKDPLSSN